jgi:transposase
LGYAFSIWTTERLRLHLKAQTGIELKPTQFRALLKDMFLPRYCSQLNPIERFWKHLKSVACANKLFADMNALVTSVEKIFQLQNDLCSPSRFMLLKYFS